MSLLRVPEVALPAWEALGRALGAYEPPCAHDAELWWTTDPKAVEAAVNDCRSCRVLETCGQYADAAKEPFGVWAAVPRTPQ